MTPRTAPEKATDDRIGELEATLAHVREDSELAYVLLGLSGALAEVRSVKDTLDIAVRTTAELFSADRCFAARWDPIGEHFELQATWGYSSEEEKTIASATGPDAYPLLQKALAQEKPIMIATEEPVEEGAAIAIPLTRWGERFGGLRVAWDSPRPFGSRDEALARGIARQVGTALNNARRFHLLQVLRSIGTRLGSVLTLATVKRAILEGLVELLNAEGAWAYLIDPTRRTLVSSGGTTSGLSLPERLARIDLDDPRWATLYQDGAPMIVDLSAEFGGSHDLVGVAIPLFEGSAREGALLAILDRSRIPAREELEACQVLAVQSSHAMRNARRFDRERAVARSLQRGLLLAEMPRIGGYRIDALYEPADDESDVGGDLYDVFELPDGRYGLVVGDVSGKGAEAAAQTAMVKFTLRAFATRDPVPSSAIFHLNNSLVRDLPEDRFVTLVYALFDPGDGSFHATVAGHPPPLIYRRPGEVESIPSHGTIVGALEGERYEQSSFVLDRGQALLSFTDGLIEARSGDDFYGMNRLAAALEDEAYNGSPDRLARRIFERARSFGRVGDDAVVLSLVRER